MIKSYCGKDEPTKEARSILFQFMANIEARGEELTVKISVDTLICAEFFGTRTPETL